MDVKSGLEEIEFRLKIFMEANSLERDMDDVIMAFEIAGMLLNDM